MPVGDVSVKEMSVRRVYYGSVCDRTILAERVILRKGIHGGSDSERYVCERSVTV